MASTNIDADTDQKVPTSQTSDEKQIGFSAPVKISAIGAPVELSPEHAAEYVEFLQLKEQFESDPKAYKALVRRRRRSPFPSSQ
jgi:hypothetical protein